MTLWDGRNFWQSTGSEESVRLSGVRLALYLTWWQTAKSIHSVLREDVHADFSAKGQEMTKFFQLFIAFSGLFVLAGCDVNAVPRLDEEANAAWAQVQNQYQRRADLVPNLVETVKGYASHEAETLTAVTEARSKVSQMVVTPETLKNPEAFKQFQEAQSGLSAALSRLMVVSERYPDLKANQNFVALQAQLEGTENRIAVARRDYIQAVKQYNTNLRSIPGKWIAALMYPEAEIRPIFEADSTAQKAPQVKF